MPYTFGGATGDDAWIAGNNGPGATSSCGLMIGWWYPTTLTATRVYWGLGTTSALPPKLLVDTTTSELRFMSNNTTDGIWVSSGAGITTNRWWCIALAYTFTDTGPAVDWRLWIGNEVQSPVPISFSQSTAPVGNNTGTTRRVWGNEGSSGSSAFQGDIGRGTFFQSASHVLGNMMTFRTAGAISDVEAENVYHRFVFPWWRGDFDPRFIVPSGTNVWEAVHWDGNDTRGYIPGSSVTTEAVAVATINGATKAANNREPRPALPDLVLRRPALHLRRAA
jgi:hypothetical protein